MLPETLVDFFGVWIAAILTLLVYSFIIKDTFLSKLTESIFIGVSVGYGIVLTYHSGIKPKIEEPLIRYYQNVNIDKSFVSNTVVTSVKDLLMNITDIPDAKFETNKFIGTLNDILHSPNLSLIDTGHVHKVIDAEIYNSISNLQNHSEVISAVEEYFIDYKTVTSKVHWWVVYIIFSLLLGLLFLSRFVPKYSWVSRYPMAYLIGIGIGMGTAYGVQNQILEQMRASFISIIEFETGNILWVSTIGNIILVIGFLSVLYYFFFSFKKEDKFSQSATKIGIAYLMIGFGSSFAFTIMARVSLLIARIDFLKFQWVEGTLKFFGWQ